jgi:hypothetical protein
MFFSVSENIFLNRSAPSLQSSFHGLAENRPRYVGVISCLLLLYSLDPAWRDGDSKSLSEEDGRIAIKRRCLCIWVRMFVETWALDGVAFGQKPLRSGPRDQRQ